MKILAITFEKCSGCCLMIDGKIIFSSSEERYTRIKSDSSFPKNSINNALSFAKINGHDLDKVLICGNQLSVYAPILNLYSSFSVEDHLNLMKDYWYPKLVKNKKISLLKILKHKMQKNQFPFNTKHAKVFKFLDSNYKFSDESDLGHQPHQPNK